MEYSEEELINALVECKNFEKVRLQFNIKHKYILLDIILDKLSRINKYDDKTLMLKQMYTENCRICDITNENIMLISDTHISSTNSNQALDYLNYVLQFCEQNKINGLIHCGDIGDGSITVNGSQTSFRNHDDARKEAAYLLEHYPTNSSVTQLLLAGNHDVWYLDKNVDILGELAKEKKIIPLGYNQAFITFNGHNLLLQHDVCYSWMVYDKLQYSFILCGHSHKAQFEDKYIKIPMLSNEKRGNKVDDETLIAPGFCVMKPFGDDTVRFERYYFEGDSLNKNPQTYDYELNDYYHEMFIK